MQSAKVWLISSEDLEKVYQKHKVGSEIALWCDVQPLDETEEHKDKRKQKHPESFPSKCEDRKDEVDFIVNIVTRHISASPLGQSDTLRHT